MLRRVQLFVPLVLALITMAMRPSMAEAQYEGCYVCACCLPDIHGEMCDYCKVWQSGDQQIIISFECTQPWCNGCVQWESCVFAYYPEGGLVADGENLTFVSGLPQVRRSCPAVEEARAEQDAWVQRRRLALEAGLQ